MPRRSDGIAKLTESTRLGKLVAVIGTGVSISLTNNKIPALSWKGLVQDGFDYGVTKGKITLDQFSKWQPQLASTDLDELLGAADFMKLGWTPRLRQPVNPLLAVR